MKESKLFADKHKNDWVVISAVSSRKHPGMVECSATVGGNRQMLRLGSIEVRHYLVPAQEYDTRSRFGFVIDEAKHEWVVPERKHSSHEAH